MKGKRCIAALLPISLLVGCASMEGKWSLSEVEPTAARRDFDFESLTIQKDGTFYAETKEMNQTESVSGTWTLSDGVLSLKEQDGELHTFDAELESGGRRLLLVRHWDGRRMTAVFQKRSS